MSYLTLLQISVSMLLVVAVLLQNKGTGLGASFGGDGSAYYAKRGMEKVLSRASIVLGILFVGVSLANFYLSQ